MKCTLSILMMFFLLASFSNIFGQPRKMDSTLKMGKVGYKVLCSNKTPEQNQLTIKPIGFESTAREMSFYIKGKVNGAEIDDLNGDGFPDLLVYMSTGPNEIGNVFAFASQENKSFAPFGLPDVMLDGKLKEGYKGHDEFMLLEGKLIRQFPIFKVDDAKDKPTGGKRVVIYYVVSSPDGRFEFKVLRSYDGK